MLILFLGCLAFILGGCLNIYFQMFYALNRIYYYWKILVKYSIEERIALLILLPSFSEDYEIIKQQKLYLEEIFKVIDRKKFYSYGEDLINLLISLEEKLNVIIMQFFQSNYLEESSIERTRFIDALEHFWAIKNLFEFQTSNYKFSVKRYQLIKKRRMYVWLISLFSYPNCSEHMPSFYISKES